MASDKSDSFQCGPFEVASNPSVTQFADKLNRLREALDQCRIQPGVGYTLARSSGGTSLTIKTGSGSSAAEDLYPFKIKIRKKDTKYQFFVIQGTIASNEKVVTNQEEWVDFEAPARIYLEATITDGAISTATLKTQPPGQVLELVSIQGGAQTQARITIGQYLDPEGAKNFQIIQNVRANISTKVVCSDGYPALLMS
jgi:hypothetical protein